MGTEWAIICDDCNIQRGLDKHWGVFSGIKDREGLNAVCADEMQLFMYFRAGLLCSFVVEHEGHHLRFISEHCVDHYEIPMEETDWWTPNSKKVDRTK